MFKQHTGDITNLVSTGRINIIIHSVNAQGKIGFGVAGALLRKWPKIRTDYYAAYNNDKLNVGEYVLSYVEDSTYVCSAVFQEHYRGSVKRKDKFQDFIDYDAVANVARSLNKAFSQFDMKPNYHFPRIGGNFANADSDAIIDTLKQHLTYANEIVLWDLP